MADNVIGRRPISTLLQLQKEDVGGKNLLYVSLSADGQDDQLGRDRKLSIYDLFWHILGYGNTPLNHGEITNTTNLQISYYNDNDEVVSNKVSFGDLVRFVTGPRDNYYLLQDSDRISISQGDSALSTRVMISFEGFKKSITELDKLKIKNEFEVDGPTTLNTLEVEGKAEFKSELISTGTVSVKDDQSLFIGEKSLADYLSEKTSIVHNSEITIKIDDDDPGQKFTLNQSSDQVINLGIKAPEIIIKPILNKRNETVWDGTNPYKLDYEDLANAPDAPGTGILRINVVDANGNPGFVTDMNGDPTSIIFGANATIDKEYVITIPNGDGSGGGSVLNGSGFVRMNGTLIDYITKLDYNTDLVNQPDLTAFKNEIIDLIPTVNNSLIRLMNDEVEIDSFHLNQATDKDIDLSSLIPSIPAVNNARITIKMNGTEQGSFTVNQQNDSEVDIACAGGDVESPLVFAERGNFPLVGDVNKLYIPTDEKKIYKWIENRESGGTGEYVSVVGINGRDLIINVDGNEQGRYNASNYEQEDNTVIDLTSGTNDGSGSEIEVDFTPLEGEVSPEWWGIKFAPSDSTPCECQPYDFTELEGCVPEGGSTVPCDCKGGAGTTQQDNFDFTGLDGNVP